MAAAHEYGDGYDGAQLERRANNKGYLGVKFAEYVGVLDAIMRRERAERDVGELPEYPSILKRVDIGLTQWQHAVRVPGRRFPRALSIMADMYEEARHRQ